MCHSAEPIKHSPAAHYGTRDKRKKKMVTTHNTINVLALTLLVNEDICFALALQCLSFARLLGVKPFYASMAAAREPAFRQHRTVQPAAL